MADSYPIIIGGGISAVAPFVLGHLVYVSNAVPPTLTSYEPIRALDGVVSYTGIPNSAGVYPAVAGATETLRIRGGAIIEGVGADSTQIGRGPVAGGVDSIAIGRNNTASALGQRQVVIGGGASAAGNGNIAIGWGAAAGGQSGVVIGNLANRSATVGGVIVGDSASASGTGAGGASVVVIGDGAQAALGTLAAGRSVVLGQGATASHPSSVVIGGGATATLISNAGQNTVTIGDAAVNTKGGTVAIGGGTNVTQTNATVVGVGSSATAAAAQAQAVVIGQGSSTNASNTVVVGSQSSATGTDNIVVGNNSTAVGSVSIAIGQSVNLTSTDAIGIGQNIGDLGVGVLQLGGNGLQLSTMLVGMGDTIGGPPGMTFRFTNGQGNDNPAGNFTLIAPRSTGAAAPATIVLRVGDIAASSAVLQPVITVATFRGNAAAANISEWVHGQVTARIVGGATNGLAIRNSANTRDNLSVSDNGSTLVLQNGSNTAQMSARAITGEKTAGATFSASNPAEAVWLANINATTSTGTVGLAYADATIFRSAIEILGGTGFGTLDLMKSGGIVRVHGNAGTTADALTIDGGAYGAGVASIRVNGLTSGAGAGAGTITNTPNAGGGNPAFWMPVNIAGTVRYIPCWAA